MRVITYVITAVVQLAAGFAGFFILLLGLNGFSEREATPSLILYVAVSLITIFGNGVLALGLGKRFARKPTIGDAGGYVIATLLVLLIGVVVLVVSLFAGFVLASVIHDMR